MCLHFTKIYLLCYFSLFAFYYCYFVSPYIKTGILHYKLISMFVISMFMTVLSVSVDQGHRVYSTLSQVVYVVTAVLIHFTLSPALSFSSTHLQLATSICWLLTSCQHETPVYANRSLAPNWQCCSTPRFDLFFVLLELRSGDAYLD